MQKNKLLKSFKAILYRRTPEILLGTGIAGMITTVVLAVRATPKALTLIEEAKATSETGEITTVDVIKSTWKCYIPAALTGAGSIVCLICAHSTNARRNAALAAAYTLSENALREYQAKVVETIGEKKERAVRDAIDKDHLEANPVSTREVYVTNNGDTLCYDHWSGRYFKSDMEKIRKAANDVSKSMLDCMYASLNEFYNEIGLAETPIGDELGWNINRNGMIDVRFGAQIAEDGTPCIVLDYVNAPTHDYMR